MNESFKEHLVALASKQALRDDENFYPGDRFDEDVNGAFDAGVDDGEKFLARQICDALGFEYEIED